MKIIKLMSIAGLVGIALSAASCGSGPSGTYNVNEQAVGGFLSSNCNSSQLSLNITENGNSVSGSGSNSCFPSESLTGTDAGNGQINSVMLTVTLSSAAMGYGNSYGETTTCSYTGSLNLANNQISGTLSNTTSYSSGCPTSFVFSGTMN